MKYQFLILVLFFTCCQSNGQNNNRIDVIPLDTTNWSVTDTIYFDFNNDQERDVLFIYNKYNKLSRPSGIVTPFLIYFRKGNKLLFKQKIGSAVFYPEFQILKLSDTEFQVSQKGHRHDRNSYRHTISYIDGKFYVTHELVTRTIQQGYIDEETGDVIELDPKTDTLHDKLVKIPLTEYKFFEFIEGFASN